MVTIVLIGMTFLLLNLTVITFFLIKNGNDHRREIAALNRKINDPSLSPEEQKILNSFRDLNKREQERIVNSNIEAFISWLKYTLPDIWNRVKDFIEKIWNAVLGLFGFS